MDICFVEPPIYDPIKGEVVIRAIVDGVEIKCSFTENALVDVAPDTWANNHLHQFASNRALFEGLACDAINAGRVTNKSVRITSADIDV